MGFIASHPLTWPCIGQKLRFMLRELKDKVENRIHSEVLLTVIYVQSAVLTFILVNMFLILKLFFLTLYFLTYGAFSYQSMFCITYNVRCQAQCSADSNNKK